MRYWQLPYLGLRTIPPNLTQFELNAFFTFSRSERITIAARQSSLHQLSLALQIGFVRMAGQTLEAIRLLPTELLNHLGKTLEIAVPDIASMRALYSRRQRTLFDHQAMARQVAGFARMSEHQHPVLVRYLHDEVLREFDRHRLLRQTKQWLYEHQLIIESDRALSSMIGTAFDAAETDLAQRIAQAAPLNVLQAMDQLRAIYKTRQRALPMDITQDLGRVWRDTLAGADCQRALRAFELATL